MSEKEETEQREPKENLLLKGWNDFVSNITVGYNKFQKSVEEKTKKNRELWNQNQEKINQFFKSAKENWDFTLKEWGAELEKTHKENTIAWENNILQVLLFVLLLRHIQYSNVNEVVKVPNYQKILHTLANYHIPSLISLQ